MKCTVLSLKMWNVMHADQTPLFSFSEKRTTVINYISYAVGWSCPP